MRRVALLSLAILTASSGCVVSVPLDGKACDEFHRCEPGYACLDGLCVSSFADAGDAPEDAGGGDEDAGARDGGPGDAGADDDAGAPPRDGGDDDGGARDDAGPTTDAGPTDAGGTDAGVLDAGPTRVTEGLAALYLLDEGSGAVLYDTAGVSPAVDLAISGETSWTGTGLRFSGAGGLAVSPTPPLRVIDACRAAEAVSLEAWVTVEDYQNGGQPRLLTLSSDPGTRDVTLLLESRRTALRVRTDQTTVNGLPEQVAVVPATFGVRRHVVATHDASADVVVFYLNGEVEAVGLHVSESYADWSSAMSLALGNEVTGDRPLQGELHGAAVYCRALTPDEVRQNYLAGSVAGPAVPLASVPVEQAALSGVPASVPAGSVQSVTVTPVPTGATSPFGLIASLGVVGDAGGTERTLYSPGDGLTLRVPLITAPGSAGRLTGSPALSGSVAYSVAAPALEPQTVGGVEYQVAVGFVLDMPVDTAAVAAELTGRMRTLAFPREGSGYVGELYVGASGPSAIYRATGGVLAHLGTGDGVTGPDDGMAQMAFAPPGSAYGDALYVCAASSGGGDGVFTATDAGGFAVVNGFNNCNGLLFDENGSYGAASGVSLYVNVSASAFGRVSSAGALETFGDVLPFVGSGYKMTAFTGSSAFGQVVLLVDPSDGTLWSVGALDTGSPVQRKTGLLAPSSVIATGGPRFGDGALLTESDAGTVSVLRADDSLSPVVSGLDAPIGLASPEGAEARDEVWFLESGRGRVLRLRPAAP